MQLAPVFPVQLVVPAGAMKQLFSPCSPPWFPGLLPPLAWELAAAAIPAMAMMAMTKMELFQKFYDLIDIILQGQL